jgi:hypothetical protein
MSIEPIDRTDLAEGDMASLREAQFVSAAVDAARAAAGRRESTPGTCLNCSARIAAPAIYCDDDCRADHEERRARERRKGRA